MAKGDHPFYKKYPGLHKPVGGYAGGSCLEGHVGFYEQQNSCSYRWQGLAKANESPGKEIYNSHHNPDCHLGASGHGWASTARLAQGKSGELVGTFETKTFKNKKTGTETEKQRILAKNFTTGFAPYSNQVHHVLPSGVLRICISDLAKVAPTIQDLICKGLLTEKYNINHKDNMIILPVKWSDACKIGLPTHQGSHPSYSASIKSATADAMSPYEKIAEQIADPEKKDHDAPAPEDLKTALEDISNKMYDSIIALQPIIRGRCKSEKMSVNELPTAVFACLAV